MSEPEKGVLTVQKIKELVKDGGRIPSALPIVDGKPTMLEIRSKRYIDEALRIGHFFEREGRTWTRWGALVVEVAFLPAPPKNHPPKPGRAFWRGAPRRKR